MGKQWKALLIENSLAGVLMRPHGALQVVSTCWQRVCVWVTGLQHERRFSTNRLLWLSGSVTGQQDNHPGRGQPIGAPHDYSALSRDFALPKILPLPFPKILSCYKICCVCAFHVSEKRRWWWLQHCLRCVCVLMIGYRIIRQCLRAWVCFYGGCFTNFSQGFSQMKLFKNRNSTDATHTFVF